MQENSNILAALPVHDYLNSIRVKMKVIVSIIILCTCLTILFAVMKEDKYETQAVIIASMNGQDKTGGLASIASQFGGLASMVGVSLPGATSSYELESLLNSDVVRERAIVDNNLLPILFYKSWDSKNRQWIPLEFPWKQLSRVRAWIRNITPSSEKHPLQYSDYPTVGDGIEALQKKKIVTVKRDKKSEMITISVRFHDHEEVALIANCLLSALNDRMRDEAKRVADENRKYLQEQLLKATDPTLRAKIYTLLTTQVETMLMTEVKENYAFKIIDPPRVPEKKVGMSKLNIVIVGFFGSILMAIAAVLFLDSLAKQKSHPQTQ